MRDEQEFSFPLFGPEGWVNQGAMSLDDRKSGRSFDGGWRWFQSTIDSIGITIYNVNMHRRACALITYGEIVTSPLGPELVLLCAQSRAIVDNNFFKSKDVVRDAIRLGMARLRCELMAQQSGDSLHGSSSAVHPAGQQDLPYADRPTGRKQAPGEAGRTAEGTWFD